MQPSVENIRSPVSSSTTSDGIAPPPETKKSVIAWKDSRVCVFCNSSEENDTLGRLLPINTGGNKSEIRYAQNGFTQSVVSELRNV